MKVERIESKRGQAMVEATLALIIVLLVFLALFNLGDLIRVKLLAENAAMKCARARAVGLNDFMLRKIARIATMPAAGKCLTASDADNSTLSRGERYYRIGSYLNSGYEAQANAILNFEYWQNNDTSIDATGSGSPISATVMQRRPRLFDFGVLTGANDSRNESAKAEISATSTIEAHYTDYLQ